MRVLLTGGSGFIGQFLVPALLAHGEEVILLCRTSPPLLPPKLAVLRSQFEVVYGDLRNFQLTVQAVREAAPDCVVHLAAAGVTNPFLSESEALRHNLDGTRHLLQACFAKTFTTRQVIVARTPGERTCMNVYAASKASAWNFCQLYARTQGWPIHGAMIFQAYGPGQSPKTLVASALQAALLGQDFPMTRGEQRRDWVYVEDVVAGLLALLGKLLPPCTAVELGSGCLTSVAEVVASVYALVGCGGRPLIGALPDRPGEEAVQVADVATTRALLGWSTAVSLKEGLAKTIQASGLDDVS